MGESPNFDSLTEYGTVKNRENFVNILQGTRPVGRLYFKSLLSVLEVLYPPRHRWKQNLA